MDPHVRSHRDALGGLRQQFAELRGLVHIVPPLIEEDRDRRWKEIGSRPSDGSDEWIEVYEREAGPEEGWGHADFAHAVLSSAAVTGWEAFHASLSRLLQARYLAYDLAEHPALRLLVSAELRDWDRRFDALRDRYKDLAGIRFSQLPGWSRVVHARELRNAITHNFGQYTERYLRVQDARRPDRDAYFGPTSDQALIDNYAIPLDTAFVTEVLEGLYAFAELVASALQATPPTDAG